MQKTEKKQPVVPKNKAQAELPQAISSEKEYLEKKEYLFKLREIEDGNKKDLLASQKTNSSWYYSAFSAVSNLSLTGSATHENSYDQKTIETIKTIQKKISSIEDKIYEYEIRAKLKDRNILASAKELTNASVVATHAENISKKLHLMNSLFESRKEAGLSKAVVEYARELAKEVSEIRNSFDIKKDFDNAILTVEISLNNADQKEKTLLQNTLDKIIAAQELLRNKKVDKLVELAKDKSIYRSQDFYTFAYYDLLPFACSIGAGVLLTCATGGAATAGIFGVAVARSIILKGGLTLLATGAGGLIGNELANEGIFQIRNFDTDLKENKLSFSNRSLFGAWLNYSKIAEEEITFTKMLSRYSLQVGASSVGTGGTMLLGKLFGSAFGFVFNKLGGSSLFGKYFSSTANFLNSRISANLQSETAKLAGKTIIEQAEHFSMKGLFKEIIEEFGEEGTEAIMQQGAAFAATEFKKKFGIDLTGFGIPLISPEAALLIGLRGGGKYGAYFRNRDSFNVAFDSLEDFQKDIVRTALVDKTVNFEKAVSYSQKYKARKIEETGFEKNFNENDYQFLERFGIPRDQLQILRRLFGGINESYLIEFNEKKYLYRRYHDPQVIEKSNLSRLHEASKQRELSSELDFVPKVYWYDRQSMLLEYLDGRSAEQEDFRDIGILKETIAKLQKLHNAHLGDTEISYSSSVNMLISDTVREYGELSLEALEAYEKYRKIIEPELLKIEKERQVYCHGDLRPYNIMLSSGNICFIDFDLAGNGHPFYDLAYLAQNLYPVYGDTAARIVLKEYLGAEPTQEDLRKIKTLICARRFISVLYQERKQKSEGYFDPERLEAFNKEIDSLEEAEEVFEVVEIPEESSIFIQPSMLNDIKSDIFETELGKKVKQYVCGALILEQAGPFRVSLYIENILWQLKALPKENGVSRYLDSIEQLTELVEEFKTSNADCRSIEGDLHDGELTEEILDLAVVNHISLLKRIKFELEAIENKIKSDLSQNSIKVERNFMQAFNRNLLAIDKIEMAIKVLSGKIDNVPFNPVEELIEFNKGLLRFNYNDDFVIVDESYDTSMDSDGNPIYVARSFDEENSSGIEEINISGDQKLFSFLMEIAELTSAAHIGWQYGKLKAHERKLFLDIYPHDSHDILCIRISNYGKSNKVALAKNGRPEYFELNPNRPIKINGVFGVMMDHLVGLFGGSVFISNHAENFLVDRPSEHVELVFYFPINKPE